MWGTISEKTVSLVDTCRFPKVGQREEPWSWTQHMGISNPSCQLLCPSKGVILSILTVDSANCNSTELERCWAWSSISFPCLCPRCSRHRSFHTHILFKQGCCLTADFKYCAFLTIFFKVDIIDWKLVDDFSSRTRKLNRKQCEMFVKLKCIVGVPVDFFIGSEPIAL